MLIPSTEIYYYSFLFNFSDSTFVFLFSHAKTLLPMPSMSYTDIQQFRITPKRD